MDINAENESLCGIHLCECEDGLCAGFASVGVYGMEVWTSQIDTESTNKYAVIDKILHLIFVSSAEKIVISVSSEALFESIKHHFEPFDYKMREPIVSIHEQNRLFKHVFTLESLLAPLEHFDLQDSVLMASALSLICAEVINEPFLPLSFPKIFRPEKMLELGNSPMEQLEIVSYDSRAISVAKLLLTMRTQVGKRLARIRIGLPVTDSSELISRYEWIEKVSPHSEYIDRHLASFDTLAKTWSLIRRHHDLEENVKILGKNFEDLISLIDYLQRHRIDIEMLSNEVLRDWCVDFKLNHHRLSWCQEQHGFVTSLVNWIARLDVAVSSAREAKKYALCRPTIIDTKDDDTFIQIMGLRHLVVEARGGTYIANDIVLGKRDYLDLPHPDTVMLDPRVHDGADIQGVLLYGINASGKSSLMKSLGVAVILAQAGFFVPAKAMNFSLFQGLYTRILSRDNVVKSLSTFGVEMLELNTIFHKANAKTLVLGDEISHGTETLSAVAIVAGTVMELSKKNSLFILTTHLHQLRLIQELSNIRSVVSLHLSVHYDEGEDRLIYDRKLRAGAGKSIYGLEFAKSLHMHGGFLQSATKIRDSLAKEFDAHEAEFRKAKSNRFRL